MKTELHIELNGVKTNYKTLFDTVKEIWKSEGNRVKDLQAMELYFKPDECKCYYVINGEAKGYFEV